MDEEEIRYGQFCPVAKAAEIVTTRWTLLVLREIISGSHRFNEIHRGVPLMSRGLLSKRLKDLEEWGVIDKRSIDDRGTAEYDLSPSGEELRPIIVALGVWGQKWIESALESGDWDAGTLMWDLKKRIDIEALPKGRTVLNIEFEDAPKEMKLWWVVIDESGIDLCQQDPGYDVNLFISSTVPVFANIWIGKEKMSNALANDTFFISGDRGLESTIQDWLQLAQVTDFIGLPTKNIVGLE